MDATHETERLQRWARDLNACWLERRFDDLARYFDEGVVVAPADHVRLTGRDACVDSYRTFVEQARIHDFSVGDVRVDVLGDVAVLTVPYGIDYEIPEGRWRGDGKELLVVRRAGEEWRAIWRTLLPGPEEKVAGG